MIWLTAPDGTRFYVNHRFIVFVRLASSFEPDAVSTLVMHDGNMIQVMEEAVEISVQIDAEYAR